MKAPESVIQRGFSAGEIAPVLHARADNPRYTDGLRTCRNFMVMRHGAVSNRPGFRFVQEAKTTSANVRLQRYISETVDQSILIEVGVNYFRFFKNGAPIETAPGVPYEVATPYTTGGLIGSWEQSGNVIAITHRLHDPRELVYITDTNWVLRLATTVPTLAAPVGLALVVPAGALRYSYIITGAATDTYEESKRSAPITSAVAAAPTAAAPHQLTWTALAGAVEYYVYCDPYGNGIYGYIGTAGSNSFNNAGFAPDFDVTPPLDRTPFVSATTRPHVATHYQQRRFYANSTDWPDRIEASRVGFFNNFGISSPLQDDDALSFRMVGRNNHAVRHMLGLKRLIVFTDGGAWAVGQEREELTPSNLPADQETYAGAAPDVPPVVIGNSAIYLQSRRSIVRDLRFDQEVEGLNGRDLTLFAAHLFDGHVIDRMDYAETPHSIVWCVRDDGALLGLTYVRELDVWGWHRHDTDGDFEQICTVPEATEDVAYAIVRRTIGGVSKRYIERLESREIITFDTDSFFVDSGLSYSGAPATVFSGMAHLNGKRIAVVADGEVISNGSDDVEIVVAGGSFTLAVAASNVHAGLPIANAMIETLDLDAHGTMIRDKQKRTGSVTLLVDKTSRTFHAGPDEDRLTPFELGLTDPVGDEFTGQIEMALQSDFSKPGRVIIKQTNPLPITILGIIPNQVIGG